MDLKVYKCFYENCTDPHPTPLPSNPTIMERPETVSIFEFPSLTNKCGPNLETRFSLYTNPSLSSSAQVLVRIV